MQGRTSPGAGACLDEAAHLKQPHGLVDGRDRDAEALAQVVLRPEALAGCQPAAEDLRLEVACDALGTGDARCEQAGGVDRHRQHA